MRTLKMETMKKAIGLALFFLIVHPGFSEYVGKMFVSYDPIGQAKVKALSLQTEDLWAFISGEMARGNLVFKAKVEDSFIEGLEHRRYIQHYLGIPVFGGEIIQHFINDKLLHMNGYYYRIEEVDLSPELSREEAVLAFQGALGANAFLENTGDVREMIFPSPDGKFRLGYEVKLKKGPAEYEIGYIDGDTGKVLARDTNLIFGNQPLGPRPNGTGYPVLPSTRQRLENYIQNLFGLRMPWLPREREDSFSEETRNLKGKKTSGIPTDAASIGVFGLPIAPASAANTEVGLGIDYHGYLRKLPTYNENNVFYLYDEHGVRPYNQAVFDYRINLYIPSDNDNYWDHDGTNVSAHANVGLIYDFYYLHLGRQGIDNRNMDTLIVTHNSQSSDNASWNGISLNFFVSGSQKAQYAAALDVVGHEFTHGVTDYSSDLIYEFQPGALNESFSDIMGCAAEFFWHPQGTGLYCAEWLVGEDAFPNYDFGITRGYVRSLQDPNRFSQTEWYLGPDPCHLSQYYNVPFDLDRGGVHINCTIYPHAYYLLAAGGTNRVSGISVSGIGLEKATKIFYRAWVYYLTKTSIFIDAANAILQSTYDLYGGSSNEFAQAKQAMRAIGWIVN